MKILPKQLRNNFPLLFVVLSCGLWFRLQGLINNTFAFTYDVGRDMLALDQIVRLHKLPLIGATTGLQGVFYGPTWYYLLTPFFILFNGNPKGILFIIILSGVATGAIGFLFGYRTGGKSLGFLIGTLIALCPVLIGISSQIWNPNPIPLFIIITFYIAPVKLADMKNNKFLWSIFLGLMLGVIFDLEIVFGSLFLLSTIIFLFGSRLYSKQKLALLTVFAGFILIQLPRILFEFRHSFLMTNRFFGSLAAPTQSSLFTAHANFYRAAKVMFGLWSNTISGQNLLLGGLAVAFIVFCFTKTFRKLGKIEQLIVAYCLIVITTYFVGFSFLNHDIESHYYVGLPVIFIVFFSMAVYLVSKYLKVRYLGIAILSIFLIANVSRLNIVETFTKSTWKGDASVYRNQVQVVDYIYEDARKKPFNYITYTPPIFDYPYQYLFQYFGRNRYGYLPDKSHQELFYLIIEPDLQLPERQTEWLRIREGDGKVIGERVFNSGIRVEKRVH